MVRMYNARSTMYRVSGGVKSLGTGISHLRRSFFMGWICILVAAGGRGCQRILS